MHAAFRLTHFFCLHAKMSSAIYKSIVIGVGKFVPERLQPLWKHPAGGLFVYTKWCD